MVTDSTGVVVYFVDPFENIIYLDSKSPTKHTSKYKIGCKIGTGNTVATYVAYTKEYVLVNDLIGDERFPQGAGWIGLTVSGVLCIPIVTSEGECLAVIELFRRNGIDYDENQLQIAIAVTGWMGVALEQNQKLILMQKEQQLNDYMLELTQLYFGDAELLNYMIDDIVNFAKETMMAERGTFFILDNETDELVGEMFEESPPSDEPVISPTYKRKKLKIRFEKDRGIAALAVKTGQTINIKDVYNDPRFNQEIDQKTGFITRSTLCIPIIREEGVIGVLQIINRRTGFFTLADEKLFRVFAMYCTLALHYTRLNEELIETEKYNEIYTEMIIAHLSVRVVEPELLVKTKIVVPKNFNE